MTVGSLWLRDRLLLNGAPEVEHIVGNDTEPDPGVHRLIIHSAETILRLFLLMTNNWIIEPLAMRFARADDRFAALLHG